MRVKVPRAARNDGEERLPSSRTYVRDLDELDEVLALLGTTAMSEPPSSRTYVRDLDQLDEVPRAARNDGEERLPSSRT